MFTLALWRNLALHTIAFTFLPLDLVLKGQIQEVLTLELQEVLPQDLQEVLAQELREDRRMMNVNLVIHILQVRFLH